jgi:TetR/AcrR family transcriptional repressor of bet genes
VYRGPAGRLSETEQSLNIAYADRPGFFEMGRQNKFIRRLPDDRRKILIAATLKCLSEEGQEGLSIRKISAAAGISVGLINHHYSSKEELVAQAYESLTISLLEAAKEAVDQAGANARDQLIAMVRSMFSKPMLDPGVLRCWLVFWGMIDRGTILKSVHDRTYSEYRFYVEGLLERLAIDNKMPLLDVPLAAIGLLALVDGLWIEWCLSQTSFSSDAAVRLCVAWIDALVLRATPPNP